MGSTISVTDSGINSDVLYEEGTDGRPKGGRGAGKTDGSVDLGNEVKVFPNPTADYVNIQLSLQEASLFKVEVLDVRGKLMLIQEQNNPLPGQMVRLDTSKLPGGTYIVNIDIDGEIQTQKLVVTH